jgi:ATP-dependent Clp protease ATP-binding subunit ClpC
MFERFTDRARKVMALANQEAQRFNHEVIGTGHILLGLVKEGSGVGANVLKNFEVDLRKVRIEVEKIMKPGPSEVVMGVLPQTPRTKKLIEYAIEDARKLNHNYVGTEHLLLGMLREPESTAAKVLMNLGLKLEEVREEVINLLDASAEHVVKDILVIVRDPIAVPQSQYDELVRAIESLIRAENFPGIELIKSTTVEVKLPNKK